MFTGYENKNDLKIVKDLGGTVTTSVSECTVLVANKIGRTAKLLCALGKIFPIYFIILPVFIYYVHTYYIIYYIHHEKSNLQKQGFVYVDID